MSLALCLLLAASVDGQAALRHASALAALGPHPWGSTRNQAAAEYVAAQMREAGLTEVRLQRFEKHGLQGTNVIGALRGGGPEMVVVSAHHDTAPGAPGAYDDGGGVGILIELARVLSREGRRARTIVFASFDAEESGTAGKGPTVGSRAYLASLGPEARHVVAAFAIEMSGWREGAPMVHPIAYADPRETGRTVIAPAWLVRAALEGSRAAGAPLGVGDPRISWLYQPAVRAFRVRLYGDDLSFLQGGRPALFASDSSFSRFYPFYHQAGDTADELDASALARMGTGVLGVVRALERVPAGPPEEPHWFAAFSHVVGWPALLAAGALGLLPVLGAAFSAGGPWVPIRLAQAVLVALLLWRHPVPALWVFLAPNLLLPWTRSWWARTLALLPALSLLGLGAVAATRGVVNGVWLAPWEIAVTLLALVLAVLVWPAGRGRSRGVPAGRRRGRGR